MTINELIIEIENGLWELTYTNDTKETYPLYNLNQLLQIELYKPLNYNYNFYINIFYLEENRKDLFLGNLLNKNADTIIDLYDGKDDYGFYNEHHISSIKNVKSEYDSITPSFRIDTIGCIDKITTLKESVDFPKVQHLIKVIKDYFKI